MTSEPFGILFAEKLSEGEFELPEHEYDEIDGISYALVPGEGRIPLVEYSAWDGTRTVTEVDKESTDEDAPSHLAVHGTKTVTFVEKETSDEDYSEAEDPYLFNDLITTPTPRIGKYLIRRSRKPTQESITKRISTTQTQTVTKVDGESSDQDYAGS